MSDTAVFYTLSTVAQSLSALVALGSVFVVYDSQKCQEIVTVNGLSFGKVAAKHVHAAYAQKHSTDLYGGKVTLRSFLIDFGKAHKLDPNGNDFLSMLQDVMYLCAAGRRERRLQRWFKCSLISALPTIAFCLLLLPRGEWVSRHDWITWTVAGASFVSLTFIALLLRIAISPIMDKESAIDQLTTDDLKSILQASAPVKA